MSTRYRKLLRLYRTLGLRAFLARLLRLAVGAIYAKHTELLIVKRLGPDATSPHRHNALRIESITAAHAPLLERFNERYRTRQKVVASTCYVRNGYRGFAAFVGDALIGYWWWVSNTTDPALTHPCVERFDLGLNDDEVAFYDALAQNNSALEVMGKDNLKVIAAELVTQVRKSVTIDWTLRESARAKIKVLVKRILRKHGYPPDLQDEATKLVLQQAELLCAEWAA